MKVEKIPPKEDVPFVTITLTEKEARAYYDFIGESNRSWRMDKTRISIDQDQVLVDIYLGINSLLEGE